MDKRKRGGQTNCVTAWLKRTKPNSNEPNTSTPSRILQELKCSDVRVSSTITSCNVSDTEFSSDIGNFLPGTCPSDIIKVKLLETSNIPTSNFVYPYSVHNKKSKEEKRFS